jgi:Na+-transporting NADH:ubiquinone oxidoreductase subunit NqrE
MKRYTDGQDIELVFTRDETNWLIFAFGAGVGWMLAYLYVLA